MLRYHISEINVELLNYLFSNNNINIGDEVVQLNNLYCVTKYIESTIIHNIQIRSSITGSIYILTSRDRAEMSNRDEIMPPSSVVINSTPRRKRKAMNRKFVPISFKQNNKILCILAQTVDETQDVEYLAEEIKEQENIVLKLLELTWTYDKPCSYCDYVHLKGASPGQRRKCCLNGSALHEPFPQLLQLPPHMLHYARDRIHHMGRNSVSYNNILCWWGI